MASRKNQRGAGKGASSGPEAQASVFKRLADYFEASKAELKKITWPTRRETLATTGAVVVLTIVLSLFLWQADTIIAKAVGLFLAA